MNSVDILFKSFTAAQKARSVLAAHGIISIIERTHTKGEGCSFILHITGNRRGEVNRDEVCSLLADIGISCGLS